MISCNSVLLDKGNIHDLHQIGTSSVIHMQSIQTLAETHLSSGLRGIEAANSEFSTTLEVYIIMSMLKNSGF